MSIVSDFSGSLDRVVRLALKSIGIETADRL
jgi:hypothetical protein